VHLFDGSGMQPLHVVALAGTGSPTLGPLLAAKSRPSLTNSMTVRRLNELGLRMQIMTKLDV